MSSLNVNRILITEANVTIRSTSCIFSAKTDITTLKFKFVSSLNVNRILITEANVTIQIERIPYL